MKRASKSIYATENDYRELKIDGVKQRSTEFASSNNVRR
jgi:hypothetical protein